RCQCPHFEEVQVKQSHAVSTVSFQAHAFSDGESIHLKLPGGRVSISSDAEQPSGHPYLHARARAPFRIKPEAAGEVGLPRGWSASTLTIDPVVTQGCRWLSERRRPEPGKRRGRPPP